VKFSWVKCSEGVTNGVSNISSVYRLYEVCCLYGFFVWHILSCSFGYIFFSFYVWLYVLYASV
jgi:cyanate lyase